MVLQLWPFCGGAALRFGGGFRAGGSGGVHVFFSAGEEYLGVVVIGWEEHVAEFDEVHWLEEEAGAIDLRMVQEEEREQGLG